MVRMLEIVRVDIVDGQTLDIELSNGHLILFDTRRLTSVDSTFIPVRNLEVLPRPGTDGQSIFWRDGPRLTLERILTLLHQQGTSEEEEEKI